MDESRAAECKGSPSNIKYTWNTIYCPVCKYGNYSSDSI